jgi:hypothetical protein
LKGGKPRDLKCPDCGGTGQKLTQKEVQKDRFGYLGSYGGYLLIRQDPAIIAVTEQDGKHIVQHVRTISEARTWIDAHPKEKGMGQGAAAPQIGETRPEAKIMEGKWQGQGVCHKCGRKRPGFVPAWPKQDTMCPHCDSQKPGQEAKYLV